MDHSGRLRHLLGALEQPLLISSLVNIRYLTGFTGSNAFLYVTPEGATFVTDGRYAEVAESLVTRLGNSKVSVYTAGLYPHLVKLFGDVASVQLEAAHLTWHAQRAIASAFDGELNAASDVVERMRLRKDLDEIRALRAAAAAGDHALSRIAELAAAATTEEGLGEALVSAMAEKGGARAGWAPIVASGANASRPHHASGSDDLRAGLLLLDYGCVVDGYHSDMTRTFWWGDGGDLEVERVHAAVLEANEAGIAAIEPGAPAAEVDRVCRQVLTQHGLEEFFVHSTGHGVGLEIHEAPSLRKDSKEVLEVGNVVSVEPGVYLPGRFGVRIEDVILVTAHGGEALSSARKELRLA